MFLYLVKTAAQKKDSVEVLPQLVYLSIFQNETCLSVFIVRCCFADADQKYNGRTPAHSNS